MKVLASLMILLLLLMPAGAQDSEDQPVENYGQVLFSFELDINDEDFGHARTLAVADDLSRYYVAGGDGLVYVYDDKGRRVETIGTPTSVPISDLAVDADKILYVLHQGSIQQYDADYQLLRELDGGLPTPYYSEIAFLDDGTFYAAQFFGSDDALFHLNPDGSVVTPQQLEFFSELSEERVGIFDALRIGQDGYLYYYNQSEEVFFQFTPEGEVLNRYRSLIDTFSLRGGILIDEKSQVLLGAGGGIEVYGAKETLIDTIELPHIGFVHDMTFVSDGRMVVVQPDRVSVIQYGERDR